MATVVLKGRSDGLAIQIIDTADFDAVLTDLQALLIKLYQETPTGDVRYRLETGNRLLTQAQMRAIEVVFEDFPRFTISAVKSEVVAKSAVSQLVASQLTHVVGGIIRSGQTPVYQGDVLFTGDLHSGAILAATGNIYILGQVHGILHAGCDGNASAVVIGALPQAGQVRINDAVLIMDAAFDPEKPVIYLNELHRIVTTTLRELPSIRPQIFAKTEVN